MRRGAASCAQCRVSRVRRHTTWIPLPMLLSMDLRIITCVVVALWCGAASAQRRPPNYSLDEMPDIQTSFSCHDKILGGYYSDPETDCQMFHVCVRIAGVGVQDFRFLCPNDTAFDQESQICDDWYNIDCEAATLYYSDNFDLFRIGHDDGGFSAVKATPIPLGPSSAPRVAPQRPKPRPRPLETVVNNAVSENDDDLYLQRAESGDRRVSQDLLRGSSSGNFFNSRNGGKEDPDDDYVAPSPAKEQELIKSPKKKNKNQVRKLLTGKRPVSVAPTEPPTTSSSTTAVYYNRYNTVQRNRPTVQTTTTTENYPTTAAPPVNYNNQRAQDFNSQRFRVNQNFAFNKKPATTTDYVQETTTAAFFQKRGNSFYQQSSAAPAYNQGNNYYQTQTTTTTAAPTNYKTNYNQGNNYYQTQTTTTTAAPTNYKTNYNQGNNYYQAQTTVAPQYNQAQTTQQQYNYNQAQTTVAPQYNYNQAQTTVAPQYNYNQAQTTVAPQYNYNQAQTTVAPQYNYNQAQTTLAPQYNYNQAQTTVAPQYNYNQQTSTPASTIYNPYQNRVSQSQQTTNYNSQNSNQNYNSQTPVNTNINYDATTLKQNYYQKQTTVNYDNYYKTSTNAPVVAYSTTLAPEGQYYDNSANIFQQTKNQYAYNLNAAGTTGNYNQYDSFKGNDGYDEPSQGETLKTAPSSNIRPSDLNAIAKSYQKPAGFNASLTASYNFAKQATTQKTVSNIFNSAKVYPTTVKAQPTAKPYVPTTVLSQSRGNAYYAQSTTQASPQPRPFSKAPEGTGAPAPAKAGKEKDASYDYAYYDEGGASEYDGIDPIAEEFSRTSHKHRTAAK